MFEHHDMQVQVTASQYGTEAPCRLSLLAQQKCLVDRGLQTEDLIHSAMCGAGLCDCCDQCGIGCMQSADPMMLRQTVIDEAPCALGMLTQQVCLAGRGDGWSQSTRQSCCGNICG